MKVCAVCLLSFHSEDSRRKYCSRLCKNKIDYLRQSSIVIELKCIACQKSFTVTQNHKTQKYCSLKCYHSVPKTDELKEKMRQITIRNGNKPPQPKGENHPRWINDRSLVAIKHRIRGSYAWRDWRKSVFERDNYTCQDCGKIGVYLEPHHIVPIRDNMEELLFDLKNGITLCRPCHKKTMWKESNYSERYSQIVAAQMQKYFKRHDQTIPSKHSAQSRSRWTTGIK